MGTNSNAPYGLKLERQGPESRTMTVMFDTGESNNIGVGDVVKTAGGSNSIDKGPIVKLCALCNSGDAMFGVVEGLQEHLIVGSGMALDRKYRPASTAMYALIRVANNSDTYSVQADDVGTLVGTANVGKNANLTGNAGGTTISTCNTASGQSTIELDSSTIATTATLQVKIVGFVDRCDNYPGVANQKLEVQLNNVESSGSTGTAGV